MSLTLFFPHMPPDTRLWQDQCPVCFLESGEHRPASVLNNGYRSCGSCHRVSLPLPQRYNYIEGDAAIAPELRQVAAMILSESLYSPGHHEYSQIWPTGTVGSNFQGLWLAYDEFSVALHFRHTPTTARGYDRFMAQAQVGSPLPDELDRVITKLMRAGFYLMDDDDKRRLVLFKPAGSEGQAGVCAYMGLGMPSRY